MENEMGLLWEVSIWEFVGITVLLAGGGAFAIGRTTALGWSGWGLMAFYVLLLTIALRFIHFALFDGTFFLPLEDFGTAFYYAVVDYIVLFIIAAIGRSYVRNRQMARQYGFLKTS